MFSAAVGVHMPPVICRDDISRGGNVDFAVFLHFVRGRNVDFAVFCISPVGETQFLPFFAFRPWAKRSFCRFLHFARGRNADFAVFCISAMAETLILPISAFPPWRKRHFSHFPLVRALGRTKTVKFGIDHTTEKRKIPNGVGA